VGHDAVESGRNSPIFQRNIQLPSSGSFYFLVLLFDPEDGSDVPPKRRLTFIGLHGVISQKIALFII
jgi:hypothetical protein